VSCRARSLPTVTLVVELGGVLLLGVLLGLLMLGDSGHQTAAGVSALALVVAGLAFWGGVWSTGRMFIEQADTFPSSVHEANVAPGSLFPADENILTPAESVIPRDAKVYLICGPNQVGCDSEWISYQLSPRLFVSNISEAQYVLVYGDSPKTLHATKHLPVLLDHTDGGVVRTRSR
jgi:hypothetical protein